MRPNPIPDNRLRPNQRVNHSVTQPTIPSNLSAFSARRTNAATTTTSSSLSSTLSSAPFSAAASARKPAHLPAVTSAATTTGGADSNSGSVPRTAALPSQHSQGSVVKQKDIVQNESELVSMFIELMRRKNEADAARALENEEGERDGSVGGEPERNATIHLGAAHRTETSPSMEEQQDVARPTERRAHRHKKDTSDSESNFEFTVSPALKKKLLQLQSSLASGSNGGGSGRKFVMDEISKFVAQEAYRRESVEDRGELFVAALDSIEATLPSLFGITSQIRRYIVDVVTTVKRERKDHHKTVTTLKKKTFKEHEKLFEGQFVEVLLAKRQAEDAATSMSDALSNMRKERDTDLVNAKMALQRSIQKNEIKEEDFHSIRSLLASVFQTNLALSNRVEDLERKLKHHSIYVPPADPALFNYLPMAQRSVSDQQASPAPEAEQPSSSEDEESEDDEEGDTHEGEAVEGEEADIPLDGSPTQRKGSDGKSKRAQRDAGGGQKTKKLRRQRRGGDGSLRNDLLDQVPLTFVEASKREVAAARLTLQRELLTCAYDSREAQRQHISLLKGENAELRETVDQQANQVRELEQYIYQNRFRSYQTETVRVRVNRPVGKFIDGREPLRNIGDRPWKAKKTSRVVDGAKIGTSKRHNSVEPLSIDVSTETGALESPTSNDYVEVYEEIPGDCLTPRPTFMPFAVHHELGVDLKRPTACITSELAIVGLNLKHQLDESMVRWRNVSSAMQWMFDHIPSFLEPKRLGVVQTIRTIPEDEWATIPHFLRTTVQPSVQNLCWTDTVTAALLHRFFTNYASLRNDCQFIRDSHMLAPRKIHLFERGLNVLVAHDVTKEDAMNSVENVPFGYVVSYFIRRELIRAKLDSARVDILQAGTFRAHFSYRGDDVAVEHECAKAAYNLWHSVQQYQYTQPLCRLFLSVCSGELPPQLFTMMEDVVTAVSSRVKSSEMGSDGMLSYSQSSNAVMRVMADLPAADWWKALLSVKQTFRANGVPLVGRCGFRELLATESYRVVEGRGFRSDEPIRATKIGGVDQPCESTVVAVTTNPSASRSPTTVLPSLRPSELNAKESKPYGDDPNVDDYKPLVGMDGEDENGLNGTSVGVKLSDFSLIQGDPTARVEARDGCLRVSGASWFVRFLREQVLSRYELVYRTIEAAVQPLCRESSVVRGLCLLNIEDANKLLSGVDNGTVLVKFRNGDKDWLSEDLNTSSSRHSISTLDCSGNVAVVAVGESADGDGGGTGATQSTTTSRENNAASKKDPVRSIYPIKLVDVLSLVCAKVPQLSIASHFPDAREEIPDKADDEFFPKNSSPNVLLPAKPSAPDLMDVGGGGGGEDVYQLPKPLGINAVGKGAKKPNGKQGAVGSFKPRRKGKGSRVATDTRSLLADGANESTVALTVDATSTIGFGTTDGTSNASTVTWAEGNSAAVVHDDKILVEWFGFVSALRSTVPQLTDRLFVETQRFKEKL